MTTDPDTLPAAAGPRILVTGEAATAHPDAAATILPFDPEAEATGDATGVIWHLPAGANPPPGSEILVADGLAEATELAAMAQAHEIVPRAEVRRVAQRFGFTPGQPVSGFSTYQLDPASVSAYEVTEDGRGVPLGDWLAQAAALGFTEVWLHSPAAEAARQGFACAMLARAHRLAPGMRFWLSGGGWHRAHFETAATGPGLSALVVPADVAAAFGPGELAAALPPPEDAMGRGAA